MKDLVDIFRRYEDFDEERRRGCGQGGRTAEDFLEEQEREQQLDALIKRLDEVRG